MQSDKYTIAWFKIAEYVSRGEKERALGVYRLLSHSFNDDAVARQLEADIYLACNEQERAIELYRQAIDLYDKTDRCAESTALLEHLILLMPNELQLHYELMNHYGRMRQFTHVYHHIVAVLQRSKEYAEKIFLLAEKSNDSLVHIKIVEQLIVALHSLKYSTDGIMPYLEKTLDMCMQQGYEDHLQALFSTLNTIDQDLYDYACAYIKD